MKACVVLNPTAGPRSLDDEIGHVIRLLTEAGWEIGGIKRTRGPSDATTHARDAAAEGCDVVFVAGGDGTIAEAVDGLVGTETALAILPVGTANVMARQLNLPIPNSLQIGGSLLDAARVLLPGNIRPVDVGRMSFSATGAPPRHFICWSGVGMDAEFNQKFNRDRDLKRRLGPGAFAVAAYFTFKDFAGTPATVRVDGEVVSRRLLMLSISNIRLYGIVFTMAPGALLDDGLLDVYCFQGARPIRMIAHLGEMLFSQHVRDPQVDRFQARQVEVSAARPLPVHVDGEFIGQTPVVIEVMPRALHLLVPSTVSPDLFVDQTGLAHPPTTLDRVRNMARDAGAAIKERSHLP